MTSTIDYDMNIDDLVSSFNGLECDSNSELPIVVYRKGNRFSTYYNCNLSALGDGCGNEFCNGIVAYYSQL